MFSVPSFICVLAASLAALGLGLDVGMISSTLVQPTFIKYFNDPSAAAIGGIVSAFSAGATFGAFGCGILADRFGRIRALQVGAAVAVVGIALQAGAVHVGMLIVGRLVCGFGAGNLTATFPVYASEVAPPQIRGMLGGLQMLMIEAAIFIATGAGFGFGTHFTSDAQWRGPLAVQAIPLLLLLPITLTLKESPRFLMATGQHERAMTVLQHLHASATGEDFALREFEEIKAQIEAEQRSYKPSWRQIFTKASWRKRVMLAAGMQCLSQLTGINCIQYYTATIYQKLGFDTHDALQLNLIYGAFGLVFAIFWVSTLDRFPRIRLLIISEIMMGAAVLVQSVLSAVYSGRSVVNSSALNAQVAMFFVFNLFFVSVGMLSWLIPPEMSPMIIRAKVNSVSVSVNNIAGIVVAQISPIALQAIGFKFFYVFVACDIAAAAIYYFFYPETSKLTLEEIGRLFGDEVEVDPATAVTETPLATQEMKGSVEHVEISSKA